ncbi:MAG: adenylate/guanylate cyclase domain-containing protein [Actinomycetota bacterium]|nr:adenylate/guanylate cyclase domain-containing protein [Actinomycetota bacterium]
MAHTSPDELPPARYASAGGVSIAYQVMGAGPDVVLVSGMLNNIEASWQDPGFADAYRQIASFARLISFDKRGTGMSDRFPNDHSMGLDEHMDDIRAVMDAVGCERAVLLAQADGVPAATVFASTFPERVSGLILYGASARALPEDGYVPAIPAEVWEQVFDTFEARWGNPDEPAGIELLTPSRVDDARWKSIVARMQRVTSSPRAAREYMRMTTTLDIREVLPAVGVPTLVLQRAGDLIYPADQARWFAEHVDGARYVEIPGTDHFSLEHTIDEVEEFVTGHRGGDSPFSALLTILFTDIVDSTRTTASLGDRVWSELLDRHDAMVRRQLGRFRGQEIKHTGDGILATFDGPARAIDAARAIRDGSSALDIQIRAGLHTGVVELRGPDVSGTAVNIAARVQACAQPSEVLVSRTLADLLAGTNLDFTDRGSHELRGVTGAWRLYAVT